MKNLHIVSHTHWDREWYKPYDFFRSKLVSVIDRLLDILDSDPSFSHFMLDGQTIVLEDYLSIRPDRAEKLKDYIAQGKIGIGPWYIQPDEFAPDGESLVRNLLVGIHQAREFGSSMMVGYLPDSFGQTSQIPQILKGFTIDSAVVMRGVHFDAAGATEFIWEGLNGDTVLGIYLLKGYSNAMFLSTDNRINTIRLIKTARELAPWTAADSVLIMNGVDHAFPQEQVPSLCKHKKGWKQGSLEEYVESVKKQALELKTLRNDLLVPQHHRVHAGISSTRMDQKKTNRELSLILERVLEPLATLASLHGAVYPRELIQKAWKTLLQNQTHDGIGGCCIDDVHREMDQRFMSVRFLTETLVNQYSRALSRVMAGKGGLSLTVFNTALRAGAQLMEATVYTDGNFRLTDDKGEEVICQIVENEEVDVSGISLLTLYLGTEQKARKITFLFLCPFPMVLGYRFFRLLRDTRKQEAAAESFEHTFSNDYYSLTFNDDGSLAVFDKETGITFPALNVYEDTGEGGDTYNHSPLQRDTAILSGNLPAQIRLMEQGPLRWTFLVHQRLRIPEGLSPDGNARSNKTVLLNIETRIQVYNHCRRIDFSVTIDNNALSHRLRALFPFGDTVESSLAETHFGVIEKNNNLSEGGEDWPEKPLPIFSMQRFCGLRRGDRSLFILNRGLQEYEIYQREESILAVTLHRGVSVMGKANLSVRPGRPSGIEVPTPDAESLGLLTREYALVLGKTLSREEVTAEADRYTARPLAVQNRVSLDKIEKAHKRIFQAVSVDTLTSVLAEQLKGLSPSDRTCLYLESSRLSVSAVKRAENENALIVRFYNPCEKTLKEEVLHLDFPHNGVFVTNLLEEEPRKISGNKEYLLPPIKPNSVLTLKITQQEGSP